MVFHSSLLLIPPPGQPILQRQHRSLPVAVGKNENEAPDLEKAVLLSQNLPENVEKNIPGSSGTAVFSFIP